MLGRPDAHQCTYQGGLTGCAWADDADDGASGGYEADVAQHWGLSARRCDDEIFDLDVTFRRGQRHALRFFIEVVHDFIQTVVLHLGSDKALPAVDHLIDRGQRPTKQQGTSHQQTWIDFMLNDEIST
ncbi:hypothetical protein D3C81_1469920 [compost metagenome]